MGIGTVTSILVHAGRQEGYHVQFSDKKGWPSATAASTRNWSTAGRIVRRA